LSYIGIVLFGDVPDILIKELELDLFINITNKISNDSIIESMQNRKTGKTPFIVLKDNSYEEIKVNFSSNSIMSFYIINEAQNLNELCEDYINSVFADVSYVLTVKDQFKAVALIKKLWTYRNAGGVLSRELITLMIDNGMLITNGDSGSISNASYDLLLGEEYYHGGKVAKITNKDPFIHIEPYDYAIVSCKEMANLPRDVSARFDISVNLFCQGIIMSNSTQVDPGFKGKLFCLLFNTSNKAIYLKRDSHFTTLEFHKLLEPTTPYKGKYHNVKSIVPYIPPNVMQGAINELKVEIELIKQDNRNLQNIILGLVSMFLAIVAIIIVFFN